MDVEENNLVVLKANSCLREEPLKRVLRNFIVSPMVESFLTVGLRVLWREKDIRKCLLNRDKVDEILKGFKEIVMIISCITVIKDKDGENSIGFSYWIVYDFPQITASKFENMLCRKILSAGFNVTSCKGLKGRGNKSYILYYEKCQE